MVLTAGQLPLPYSVSTFAGGTNVGDGGLATSAALLDAEGITTDRAGNIYIADAGDMKVRMIAPNGIISTLTSNLVSPCRVAADALGNVYVADLGGNRIQKIAPNGLATTVLAQLSMPRNLPADGVGNIYFSEFSGQRVRKIGADGTVTVVAGTGVQGSAGDGGLATVAQLSFPAGLALDAFGNLYIADNGNNVATNHDGTVNSNSYPAVQGSIVTFCATGIGQGPVSASVGGAAANVSFVGDAPGFIGVSQINAQVPTGIASGPVPLFLTTPSTQSQAGVSLFVQ